MIGFILAQSRSFREPLVSVPWEAVHSAKVLCFGGGAQAAHAAKNAYRVRFFSLSLPQKGKRNRLTKKSIMLTKQVDTYLGWLRNQSDTYSWYNRNKKEQKGTISWHHPFVMYPIRLTDEANKNGFVRSSPFRNILKQNANRIVLSRCLGKRPPRPRTRKVVPFSKIRKSLFYYRFRFFSLSLPQKVKK